MKKFILSIIVLLFTADSRGQIVPVWVSDYGGITDLKYHINDMVTDRAGNVYEVGYQRDSTFYTGIVTKYNSAGIQQWVDTSFQLKTSSKIAVDRLGNVYVIDLVYGLSFSSDYLTRKYDSNGNIKWTSIYNGNANKTDVPHSIFIDDSLNVYVTGEACETFGYVEAFSTVKYDSLGVQQWVAKTDLSNPEFERAYAVAVDSMQNVYVTGQTSDTILGSYLTVKYNKFGVEQWQARYAGGKGSMGMFINVSNDGFIYVGGMDFDWVAANQDYLMIKYDSLGNEMWTSTYDAQASLTYGDYDVPSDMFVDQYGNAYLTGTQFRSTSYDAFCTVKFDKNGNLKWAVPYSGVSGQDDAKGIVVDNNSNVYVTGESEDTPFNLRILATIKYDSLGNLLWTAKQESSINSFRSTEIGLDSLNNIYIAGAFENSANSFFTTIKYDYKTGITGSNFENNYSLYPNPSSDKINLKITSNKILDSRLEIINLLGQTVKIGELNILPIGINEFEIDISHFSNGLYFIQVRNDAETRILKFIKN